MIHVDDKLPEKEGYYNILVNGKPLPPEDEELNPVHYDPIHGWIFDFYALPQYRVTHWEE